VYDILAINCKQSLIYTQNVLDNNDDDSNNDDDDYDTTPAA